MKNNQPYHTAKTIYTFQLEKVSNLLKKKNTSATIIKIQSNERRKPEISLIGCTTNNNYKYISVTMNQKSDYLTVSAIWHSNVKHYAITLARVRF
ncbi:MAG: hypothetical protein ACLROI_00655 [Beduini sp.]|uniref:hypothetical protein n=1 Tax=Beduini sp. TaxID=1922300 RepID=UPI0011CA3DE9